MSEGDIYLKNTVEGMTNDELILFIYSEMLKVLKQTLYYFEKNDIEKRVNSINKGIEVVQALISILNFDAGDIAYRLRSLYLYSMKKLTAANFEKDPKAVEEVHNIFKNLHSGWSEKIDKDRKDNAGASQIPTFNTPPQQQSTPAPQAGGYGDAGERKGLDFYG